MKSIVLFLLLAVVNFMAICSEPLSLDNLMKPSYISMDDTSIYVVDGVKIHVFDRKSRVVKRVFGKEGEGPQEFRQRRNGRGIQVFSDNKRIVVNSPGKISMFSLTGNYLKEYRTQGGNSASRYVPFGKGYAALVMGNDPENGKLFFYLKVFNHDLAKGRELAKIPFTDRNRLEFPVVRPQVESSGKNICLLDGNGDNIRIIDSEGKTIKVLKPAIPEREVKSGYISSVHSYFKNDPQLAPMYPRLKEIMSFRKRFPAIETFWTDRDGIYVLTFNMADGKRELHKYSCQGELTGKKWVEVAHLNPVLINPSCVKDGALWQLVEDEESEEWKLKTVKLSR